MRSGRRSPARRRAPTFTETARREQIVRTTIGTIARRGAAEASLGAIAARAHISKASILYHFRDKDELIGEVLRALWTQFGALARARVDAESDAAGKLTAYVDASFDFMRDHRDEIVAWFDLWGSVGQDERKRRYDRALYAPCRLFLERIFQRGARAGELRPTAAAAAATVLQGAIDGVMLQWVIEEGAVDLGACRAELRDLVARYRR
jgi:TetR/AcrR family transcriptional regulator, fatty acid metabolism regulator protein